MEQLLFKEKVAYSCVLTTLALIDGDLNDEESDVITNALSVDKFFLLESLSAQLDHCITYIKEQDIEKHKFILNLIYEVVVADGICKLKEAEFSISLLNALELINSLHLYNPLLYILLKGAMEKYNLNYSNISF